MNGVSISASVDFASWFKETKRGLILGEQCMGPLTGTCGNPILFELKNTRISVATSTMRSYTYPGLQVASDPIYPDIPIKYSVLDFRRKNDPIVEYVKNLK
jgi:C-terminal processing protease CtpA/Prc